MAAEVVISVYAPDHPTGALRTIVEVLAAHPGNQPVSATITTSDGITRTATFRETVDAYDQALADEIAALGMFVSVYE